MKLIGFFALVLLCSLQPPNVLAEVAKPENVSLVTLNTQYLLTWDWDQRKSGNHTVTFTAEFLAKYKMHRKRKEWTCVCERTVHTHCNLTASELHYHGMYVLRVRTNTGRASSDWVLKDFCPDKDADLGPPSRVELAAVSNLLDVSISDPLTSTRGSMKELIPSMYYRIHYWIRSQDLQEMRPMVLDSSANLVTLPELAAWTWYCVRVQSRYDYYNHTSSLTEPHCMQTEGVTPLWQILLYFVGSLVLCFLVVLLPSYASFKFYKVLKATFYPSIQLPTHIREYLCDSSPGSDMPRLLTPESESELICDRLSICPEAVLLEIHTPPASSSVTAPPPGLEQDSGRHSRQGSGGSGDSGVYSTEGGSAQQRSGQTGKEGEDSSWQSLPPSLEQVKMEEIGGELADEGVMDDDVMDLCV